MHSHDDCGSESIFPVYRPGRTWVEASRRQPRPRPPIHRARRCRRGCRAGGWLITFIFWLLPGYSGTTALPAVTSLARLHLAAIFASGPSYISTLRGSSRKAGCASGPARVHTTGPRTKRARCTRDGGPSRGETCRKVLPQAEDLARAPEHRCGSAGATCIAPQHPHGGPVVDVQVIIDATLVDPVEALAKEWAERGDRRREECGQRRGGRPQNRSRRPRWIPLIRGPDLHLGSRHEDVVVASLSAPAGVRLGWKRF